MALLGAHVSIAGGVDLAVENGTRIGCEAIQIFSRNQRQWRQKPLPPEMARAYREKYAASGLRGQLVHGSYLVNLGGSKPEMWKMSLEAFIDEATRTGQLGIPAYVFHPGAHMGQGEEKGLELIATGLGRALDATAEYGVVLAFEVMAGAGSVLGYRFEHAREVMNKLNKSARFGLCLDTCHLHASGHDLTTREAYEETFRRLDQSVGLARVKGFHLNDSLKPLGARRDRHANIGLGTMTLEPFWRLVHDARFKDLPMVLETPPGTDLNYTRDLIVLKGLREFEEPPTAAQGQKLMAEADKEAKKAAQALEKAAKKKPKKAAGTAKRALAKARA